MQNHLFIGLGGQGGRSLAEVRKVMEQRHRDQDHLKQLGARWDFLSIDSSRDVWNTRKFWNYFGKNLELAPNQQLDMKSGMLGQDLDAHSVNPTISPWLGERSFISSYLNADKGTPGANQRRRFGRFLFARNADNVRQTLASKVGAMTAGAGNECCFHIFATLAGGTGSGGLVDLVTTLRDLYPNAAPQNGFPIYLYLYLTSQDDGKSADVGYFYQNQFAALRDLNALMVGRLRPTMLDAQHGGAPFDGGVPITAALVASSINSANRRVPIEAQIKVIAESCFERIYAYLSGNLAPNTQASLTLEDIITAFGGEPMANPERSYRFGSLGMRRWEVPNEKIEELIALDLVSSSLRQMLYNHWQAGSGYGDVPLKANEGQIEQITSEIQQIIQKHTLTATTAEGLHQDCVKTIDDALEGQLKKSVPGNELALLESQIATFFEHHLGGNGAKARLAAVRALHNASADEVVVEVDQALTRYWREAAAPVGLVGLIECLDRFTAQLSANLNAHTRRNDSVGTLANRMAARKDEEWEKLTALSRMVGKRTALLRAHAADLKAKYRQSLDEQVDSSDFALKSALIQPLMGLRANYAAAQTQLLDLLRESKTDGETLDVDLRALRDPQNAVRYEFDQDKLDVFRKTLRGDQANLAAVASALRGVVVTPGRTLRGFDAEERARAEDSLRNTAGAAGRDIHTTLVTRGVVPPVLGDSLMDRLQQRYRSDLPGLTTAAREFVERATSCLYMDGGQLAPAIVLGGGVGVPPMPRRIFVLAVPQHPFSAQVQQALLDAIPAGPAYVSDHYEHGDPSQLRLLVCDYWMAARYMAVAAELTRKYEAGSGRQEVRYFCNIDPDGERDQRPNLFLPTLKELQARLAADFWIGQAVGTIIEDNNGASLIKRTDQGDRSEWLGSSLQSIRGSANLPEMLKINLGVASAVAALPPARKRELLDQVSQEESDRQAKHGITSPEYREWQDMRPYLNHLLN